MNSNKVNVPTKIAFVGMSGIGKSHWAHRLEAEAGFERISCDEKIQAELLKRYHDPKVSKIDGVAAWMKNPWEEGHREKEAEYLEIEERVTQAALSTANSSKQPTIIDTTGSVIYLSQKLINQLKTTCQIVWLKHSEVEVETLYQTFLKHPKPLIWGEAYRVLPQETPQAAMARCFKELLSFRSDQYQALAHKSLSLADHKRADLSVTEFLKISGAA